MTTEQSARQSPTSPAGNAVLAPQPVHAAGDDAAINYAAERLQMTAWFVATAALLGIAASIVRISDLPMLYDVTRWLIGGSAMSMVIMIACLIDTWGKRSFVWPRWTWRFSDLGLAGLAALLAAQWSYTSADPAVALYVAGPLWLIAIAGALLATWPRHESVAKRETVQSWELFALAGLLLLAFALRAGNLHGFPEVLIGDESRFALTARAFNQGLLFRPFVTAGEGQWGLWYLALGAFTRVLGETVEAIRWSAAVFGTLSILAAYAVTRLLWGRRPALIAAALLAAYHFHLHFSRSALNNIYDTLFFMTAFGFFWLGWLRQSRWPWLLGAVTLGLAQYFSAGGRGMVIEMAVLGLFWLLTDRGRLKAQRFNIALAIGVFTVTVIPIVYFARLQFDDYLARFNQTNILRNGWLNDAMQAEHTGAVQILWQQLIDTIKLMITGPDTAFYPGQALLTPAMVVLAVVSLLYLLRHIKDGRAFFLVSSLAVAVLFGGVLAISPLTGAYRFVGAMPLLYIAIAVIIDRGWDWLEQHWPARRRVFMTVGIVLIAALMIGDAYYYFGTFSGKLAGANPDFDWGTRVGDYLHAFEAQADTWQVICIQQDGRDCQHPSIQFLAPRLSAKMAVLDQTASPDSLPLSHDQNFVIVVAPQYTGTDQLRANLPQAQQHEQHNAAGELIFTAFEYSAGQP
jgi:Dolichyl-phosphate-mannose-protein mannosyltransferase